MTLAKRYSPSEAEPALEARWQAEGTYYFQPDSDTPLYAMDTPPATVSGKLHLGHVYSYSHPDFMARFFRMRGFNVYYPMGFDDNGLPTERLVEKRHQVTAAQIGRQAFIEKCLAVSEEAEGEYQALWQRLGLSIDWRYRYRTIDEHARRCSQHSFLDLYRKGLAYQAQSPSIWCPECRTAIAQAEMEDRERQSEFVTLPFSLANGQTLPIATTRPELLAACVAVFVHPQDARYQDIIGQQVRVPLYGQAVTILPDPAADPQKGTGAVMCCTFGDQADVAWWKAHQLPLIEAISTDGRMTAAANLPDGAGELTGLPIGEARKRVKGILQERGLLMDHQLTQQSVRVHERCDTPVEYRILRQWFIRVLDQKETFLELGRQLEWHPEHMHARYQAWVENLNWDWCISRQRYFGVPFPVWYCEACGALTLAEENQLPVDPLAQQPAHPCSCGSDKFIPESDVMDTWATSSVSPQIAAGWLDEPARFDQLFPMTLRPQGQEIIRTWAFYSIVKSWYHFKRLPWHALLISGWGIAGEGMGKISKSKGGGPMPPLEMIQRYSADAVRYWAASTATGRDAVISEEKIQQGSRLVTKLWNVARFAEPFISADFSTPAADCFTPTDRWILAACDALVRRVTEAFESYEYAAAKNEIENFFWHDLADNYLEMAKQRLYDEQQPAHLGAAYTLRAVFKTLLQLFAPLLPYVTDTLWRDLFAEREGVPSIHRSTWPTAAVDENRFFSGTASAFSPIVFGEQMVAIASAVRRYKSEHALSLGSELERLQLAAAQPDLAEQLSAASVDLMSVTRARRLEVRPELEPDLTELEARDTILRIGIQFR